MFRRRKTHIKYEVDGVIIRPATLNEEYNVGRWNSNYSTIKMGYEYEGYKSKYSDIIYVMIINNEIVGYFMAYSEINICKSLILYDFAVDVRAYSKYSKILIDYIIKYANYNGYNQIVINKIDKYTLFINFIIKNYKIENLNDKIYLMIHNPRISSCQKYLSIYKEDKVKLEELYFLYDLRFDILKNKCRLKLNDEEIIIDRLTGLISFPENVKLIKEEVILNQYTKSLIYLIIDMYHTNDIKQVVIDYDIHNLEYYEANIDGVLYVSKNLKEIRNDNEYINSLINKGYDKVVPNQLSYSINDRSFSNTKVIYRLMD